MRPILSLGLAAVAAATAAADTTVAVLEFGPGGSVHRTTSSSTESSAAAVSSLWDALHRPTTTKGSLHAGMAVAPDLFASPDAGIVVGIYGEGLRSMPTALSLMDDHEDVVGHVHVPGPAAAGLMKKAAASKDAEAIAKEEVGNRLASVAATAARGELEGMEALSLTVDTAEAAAAADEHLGRMLATLKTEAAARKKTVVVHLVAEGGGSRRRLEENQGEDGENQNNNNNNQNGQSSSSNYKSMYEIQTFNLYLWTAVGLFVVVYSVIGCFIDMPQFPDTLLYGETKMGAD